MIRIGAIRLAVVALALFVVGLPLFAQGDRGAITGLVADATGAVIPGAEVTATEISTAIQSKAVATSAGLYRIPYLSPGTYRVAAAVKGFKTAIVQPVIVPVAGVITVNLSLQVGDTTESVTVSAELAQLESTSSELGYSVSSADYHEWPISSNDDGQRQIQSFIFNSLPGTKGDSYQGSINGGPNFSHEVYIEGMSIGRADIAGDTAEYTPSVDAVSEFRLQTGGLSAQYGGGLTAVANFSIKSGTNQYHGTAYDYLLNEKLNARSFGDNAFDAPKPPFRQNSFGATLGGPIQVPKVYNGKDRTFFFFSYEGDRKRNYGRANNRTLPAAAFKKGDFSSLFDPSFTGNAKSGTQIGTDGNGVPVVFGAIYDPRSTTQLANGTYVRTPFGGNKIPASQISKVSQNILSMAPIPDPSFPFFLRNQPGTANQPVFRLDTFGGKLDQVITDKHRLMFFINSNERQRYNGAGNGYLPVPGSASGPYALQIIHGTMIRVSEDWTIAPTLLNHVGFGYNRLNNSNSSLSLDQNWPSKIGLGGVAQTTFPQVSWNGTAVQGGSLTRLGRNNAGIEPNGSYIVQNDTTWVRGSHNIRFGLEIRKYYYNQDPRGGTSGSFTFGPAQTADPSNLSSTGFSFASFLLGAPRNTSLNISDIHPGSRFWNPAFYVADDWKVTRKLTLNLGLRWDIAGGLYEIENRSSGLDPTKPNPGADGYPGALVFLEDLHRRSFQNTYWKELGPRIGFAYQVSNRLVLRGGYGLMYSPPIANNWGLATTDGYSGSKNFSPSSRNPVFYWDQGYPAYTFTLPDKDPALDNGSTITYIPRDSNRQPYAQNYSFGLQYLINQDTTLQTSYVGNRGSRLAAGPFGNMNQLNPKYLALGDTLLDDISDHPEIRKPYASFEGTVAQALLPFPQYSGGGVTNMFPYVGTSDYNALQVVVSHRYSKGLGFLVSYAFQKTLANTDDGHTYYGSAQDVYNRGLDRSVASFDRTQQLRLTWIADLPFGKGRQFLNRGGVLNQVLGGWTVTAIQGYQSGNPLQIVSGYDNNGDYLFNNQIRGDMISGVPLRVASGKFDYVGGEGMGWINPAAFAPPPTTPNGVITHLGTAPRYLGSLRGPRQISEDFGIYKRFHFREEAFAEFRCDMLNAFNRPGRADPITDLADPNFGRIVDVANSPRQIQLSLRITF